MQKIKNSEQQLATWKAVANLYQSYFTGLVLYSVSRLGPAKAEEFVYEVFCHQRRERFLPGLKKLAIDHLPPAVAAAQYHYLSNHIGGVSVEYMYETDKKAWIRYSAPRWIWSGTALCGIPPEVSKAMLLGWHAQNGVMLNNSRLGFVCTKQTADGQSGLEGYYFEYDYDLSPSERLRFARQEDAPDFDLALAPTLPISTWPAERLAKAHRNYAMEYVRSAYPVAMQLWGPDEAEHHLKMAARLVGMQLFHETVSAIGNSYDKTAKGLAEFLYDFLTAQGDNVELQIKDGAYCVQIEASRFLDALPFSHVVFPEAWNGLIQGFAQALNHRINFDLKHCMVDGRHRLEWLIKE